MARRLVAPAENGVDDSIQFFELNVTILEAAWNACREPLSIKDASNAFGSAGVCEDVEGVAFGRYESHTVPRASSRIPPFYVFSCSAGDAAASAVGIEL